MTAIRGVEEFYRRCPGRCLYQSAESVVGVKLRRVPLCIFALPLLTVTARRRCQPTLVEQAPASPPRRISCSGRMSALRVRARQKNLHTEKPSWQGAHSHRVDARQIGRVCTLSNAR